MTTSDFGRGAVSIAPVLVGVAPFAMVAGIAGVTNGFNVVETMGFSVITFAGAAQIAALDLLGDGAPAVIAISTALIINLRFLMYSAALTPHFRGESRARRSLAAYLLVDHAFALLVSRAESLPTRRSRQNFYLGACVAFWITWQVGSLAGSLLGSGLPAGSLLSFAVPLSFLALLVPQVSSRPTVAAAVVAGAVAVGFHDAPANLGMLAGTLMGILVGFVLITRRGRKTEL